MKRFIPALLIILSSAPALADGHKLGVGFILGDPTALSARYHLSPERAIDAQLAFASDWLLVYGDYHWKFPGVFNSTDRFIQQLTPYLGGGAALVFASKRDHAKGAYFDKRDDSFALAVRIPFGIEWMWDKVPLGIGLEIAPGIVLLPATDGFLHGGITFRYHF